MNKEFELTPHLVQRLRRVRPSKNPFSFSFGGGLKNGGFSPEAIDIINNIFDFDYMGSSEFEWGAVPKSFQEISLSKHEYIQNSIDIDVNIPEDVHDYNDPDKTKKRSGFVKLYYYCRSSMENGVIQAIKDMSAGDIGSCSYLRERSQMQHSLKSILNKELEKIVGWLDIKNHYFIFSDEKIFKDTMSLFETIETTEGVQE